MSFGQPTEEVRPDDEYFCDFPRRKLGAGLSSAILRFCGGLRDPRALSEA